MVFLTHKIIDMKYFAFFILLTFPFIGFSQTDSIWTAIDKNDIGLLQEAVENGGDVNALDSSGLPPLAYVAAYGYVDMMQYLIDNGADVNKLDRDNGTTPLMYAAKYGKLASCVYLVKHGADIDFKDNDKNPVILYAQSSEINSVIDYIKDTTIFDFKTALFYEGLYEINWNFIDKALDMGVDVNVMFYNGYPPLSIATYFGNYSIIKSLIDEGADVNKMSADTSATPLMIAVTRDNYEATDLLLSKGADPNIKNIDGVSAIDLAEELKTSYGCKNIYYLLLDPEEYIYNPDSAEWICISSAITMFKKAKDTYLTLKYLKMGEYKIDKELSLRDTLYAYRMTVLWLAYNDLEEYDRMSRIADKYWLSAKKAYGEKSDKYLRILWGITTVVYFNADKKDQSLFYADQISKALSKRTKENDSVITKMLSLAGSIYFYYQDYKKAIKTLTEAMESCEHTMGKNSELYGDLCKKLYDAYVNEEQFKKAEKIAKSCNNK